MASNCSWAAKELAGSSYVRMMSAVLLYHIRAQMYSYELIPHCSPCGGGVGAWRKGKGGPWKGQAYWEMHFLTLNNQGVTHMNSLGFLKCLQCKLQTDQKAHSVCNSLATGKAVESGPAVESFRGRSSGSGGIIGACYPYWLLNPQFSAMVSIRNFHDNGPAAFYGSCLYFCIL